MLRLNKRISSALRFFLELLGMGIIYLFILTLTDGSFDIIRTFLVLLN